MPGFRGQQFAKGVRVDLVQAVAVVCLVLVALLTVAQAAHTHANPTDADHCQLCIAMHAVVPTATAAAAVVFARLGTSDPVAEPIVVLRQPQFRLFIRPPPVSL